MGKPSDIVVINTSYQEIATAFLQHQLMLGYSTNGARTKTLLLNEFLHFCETNGVQEVKNISAQTINDYYAYIIGRPNKITGEKLSLKTAHSHTRSIELLFIMLQAKGQLINNPTSTLKFPYPPQTEQTRSVLTQSEIRELYETTDTAQERAILSLAYGCGLRVSELVAVNTEDIRLREKIIIIPKGKGNKRRVIPMSAGIVKDLKNYFYQTRILIKTTENKAFILNSRDRRMQEWTYNSTLKQLIDRTGNQAIKEKQITIHNLRHSIATHLIEQKMPLEQVRMFLGHSQLETTQIYTHISQEQLKTMMNDEF